ncbi:hypothetical protein P43SY_004830 [Pythium insidiosum]|uniref:Uncharacterized protein n=1 Tax=Pythium insidiosum TaxID=114742 RepID=A0AAD5Q7V2_PYTIN|nr:hypothetical protein P43SY_004830 [Pythium insidiosum]
MGSQLSLLVSVTTLVVTVIYYYKMVVLTELTTEATFFNTLYAEYATPPMMDALRAVEEFSHHTKISPQQIVCKPASDQLWDKKFDQDWQRLFHWYQKLVYFHRMGLLHDRFFQEFPGAIRAKHFVQHVEPFAINSCQYYQEKNCTDVFDYLRQLYELPPPLTIDCGAKSTKKTPSNAKKEEL